MRIPPIAIIAGLGAIGAAVMLSTSKAKASSGGGSAPITPPADCEAERKVLGQKALDALNNLQGSCKGSADPACPVLVGVIDGLKTQFQILLTLPWGSNDPKANAAGQAVIALVTTAGPKLDAICASSPSPICDQLSQLGAELQPAMLDWLERCHPEAASPPPVTRTLVATAPTPISAGIASIANVLYHQAQAGTMSPPSGTGFSLPGNLGDLANNLPGGLGNLPGNLGGLGVPAQPSSCDLIAQAIQQACEKIGSIDPNDPAQLAAACALNAQVLKLQGQARAQGCAGADDWYCNYALPCGASGLPDSLPNVPQVNGACPPGYAKTGKGDCQWDGVKPNADGTCKPGFDIGDDGWCHLLSGVDPSQGLLVVPPDACQAANTAYNAATTAYNAAADAAKANPLLAAGLPALESAMLDAHNALIQCQTSPK